jgi:hypothetical protein
MGGTTGADGDAENLRRPAKPIADADGGIEIRIGDRRPVVCVAKRNNNSLYLLG